MPLAAAIATAVVGAINLASVLTPELPVRLRTLMAFAPAQEMRLAHALALPAGLALLGAAWQLGRRRRRALHAAVALLAALGTLDLARGLDVEEALISWTLAGALWRARGAFWVRHDPARLGRALRRACGGLAGATGAAIGAVALAAPHARSPLPLAHVPAVALGLLTLHRRGPAFAEPFGGCRSASALRRGRHGGGRGGARPGARCAPAAVRCASSAAAPRRSCAATGPTR